LKRGDSVSPLSLPVLGLAFLVSLPALWQALVVGTASTIVGLSWFLVAIGGCWMALWTLVTLIGPPPERPTTEPGEEVADVPTVQADSIQDSRV
jgi:hypothetical protein